MSSGNDHISVDAILINLGTLGRYQLLQATLLCLTNLTASFNLLSFVFIAQSVEHQCSPQVSFNTSDNVYEECQITTFNTTTNETASLSCQSWSYFVQKQHSIVSEWDLVCDNVFYARLPQSLFIVGQAIGAVLFSTLSDKFGRKPFLIVSDFLTGCVGIGLAFAPNITVFSILRLVNGICQQGIVIIGITLLLETFPSTKRTEVATCHLMVWSVSMVVLTLVAYLLRHLIWRMLQLALVTVSVTVLFQIIFLRESLRWLITNRKEDRAMEIIKTASKLNHVDISSLSIRCKETLKLTDKVEDDQLVPHKGQRYENTDDTTYTMLDLITNKFLLKQSAVIWFTWLVDSLTYFSLYLTSSSLADDFYINFLLNSLAEVPTGPLYWFFGRKWGRRRFFMIFHILAGVCLLLATGIKGLAVGEVAYISATVLAFLGKVGNAACFNGLFMYVPEIYPTNLRTAGIGAGSTAARVGGCIAPFVSMLAALVPWAPGTIFGSLCLVTAGLNFRLPESEGQEMPQTTEDIKAWK